jgi:carbamoylphosphate synthase large subunit
VIDIRPRSQHDYRFVGINSRMKGSNYLVSKVRRYLEKRVLLRLQEHEELAR